MDRRGFLVYPGSLNTKMFLLEKGFLTMYKLILDWELDSQMALFWAVSSRLEEVYCRAHCPPGLTDWLVELYLGADSHEAQAEPFCMDRITAQSFQTVGELYALIDHEIDSNFGPSLDLTLDLDSVMALYWSLSDRIDDLFDRVPLDPPLAKGETYLGMDQITAWAFQATAELYVSLRKQMNWLQ